MIIYICELVDMILERYSPISNKIEYFLIWKKIAIKLVIEKHLSSRSDLRIAKTLVIEHVERSNKIIKKFNKIY